MDNYSYFANSNTPSNSTFSKRNEINETKETDLEFPVPTVRIQVEHIIKIDDSLVASNNQAQMCQFLTQNLINKLVSGSFSFNNLRSNLSKRKEEEKEINSPYKEVKILESEQNETERTPLSEINVPNLSLKKPSTKLSRRNNPPILENNNQNSRLSFYQSTIQKRQQTPAYACILMIIPIFAIIVLFSSSFSITCYCMNGQTLYNRSIKCFHFMLADEKRNYEISVGDFKQYCHSCNKYYSFVKESHRCRKNHCQCPNGYPEMYCQDSNGEECGACHRGFRLFPYEVLVKNETNGGEMVTTTRYKCHKEPEEMMMVENENFVDDHSHENSKKNSFLEVDRFEV